jgi:hypothetical protein
MIIQAKADAERLPVDQVRQAMDEMDAVLGR